MLLFITSFSCTCFSVYILFYSVFLAPEGRVHLFRFPMCFIVFFLYFRQVLSTWAHTNNQQLQSPVFSSKEVLWICKLCELNLWIMDLPVLFIVISKQKFVILTHYSHQTTHKMDGKCSMNMSGSDIFLVKWCFYKILWILGILEALTYFRTHARDYHICLPTPYHIDFQKYALKLHFWRSHFDRKSEFALNFEIKLTYFLKKYWGFYHWDRKYWLFTTKIVTKLHIKKLDPV